jgi:hypothetical protein
MMNTLERIGILILALLLIGCTESQEGDRNRIVGKQQPDEAVKQQVDGGGMVPAPDPDGVPPTFAKVLAVDMAVGKHDLVTLKNPRVQYGEPPNHIGNPPMFSAQLMDPAGAVITSLPLWDPRWTFVWSDEQDRDYVEVSEAADFVVIVPFDPAMATLTVTRNEKWVAAVDLAEAVKAFCAKNPKDPDCLTRPAPAPPKVQ